MNRTRVASELEGFSVPPVTGSMPGTVRCEERGGPGNSEDPNRVLQYDIDQ